MGAVSPVGRGRRRGVEATQLARRLAFRRKLEEYVKAKEREGLSRRYVQQLRWTNMRNLDILVEGGRETNPMHIGPDDVRYLMGRVPPRDGNFRMQQQHSQYLGFFLAWCGNDVVSMMRLRWPEGTRLRTDWLTAEQVELVRQAVAGDPELAMLLHLEADLGLRRVEVQRLRMRDVAGDVVRVTGKGRAGGKPRDLHKHPDTDGVLEDYLVHRASVVRRARAKDPSVEVPDDLMLCWHMGRLGGMRATALDRRKDHMVDLSGIRFGHHTLRRTWGRELWKAGVPVETISEMMGHSETKTTLRYLGINFDDQGEALNLLYARQQQARGKTLTKTLTSPQLHQKA